MSKSNLLSLLEIFNESIFRIPDFQGEYQWGNNQLDHFWKEIMLLKNGCDRYTGLIKVKRIDKDDVKEIEKWKEDLWLFDTGQKAYYILFGQQRLTTMIILIKVILNKMVDAEIINFKMKEDWIKIFLSLDHGSYPTFIFGYEKDNPSDEYFRTKILGQSTSSADKYPETLYTNNLTNAKSFFENKIKILSTKEKEKVFIKVVNKLKFILYEIDSDLD